MVPDRRWYELAQGWLSENPLDPQRNTYEFTATVGAGIGRNNTVTIPAPGPWTFGFVQLCTAAYIRADYWGQGPGPTPAPVFLQWSLDGATLDSTRDSRSSSAPWFDANQNVRFDINDGTDPAQQGPTNIRLLDRPKFSFHSRMGPGDQPLLRRVAVAYVFQAYVVANPATLNAAATSCQVLAATAPMRLRQVVNFTVVRDTTTTRWIHRHEPVTSELSIGTLPNPPRRLAIPQGDTLLEQIKRETTSTGGLYQFGVDVEHPRAVPAEELDVTPNDVARVGQTPALPGLPHALFG
jgi:hypothetical protein